MIFSSQFGAGVRLGAIVQGLGLTEPEYVRLDGATHSRTAKPRLSSLFPIGKMTGTVRTLAAVPAAVGMAVSPTYFVAPASASLVQHSADGVTWATSAVAGTISAIAWAGNRFIATYAGAVQPSVTTADNPNAAWTATTSGPTTVVSGSSVTRIAYSPALGRAVVVPSTASSGNVYTLDNGSTAWATRSGLTAATRQGVCWTGAKFIIVSAASAIINASADGISWTDASLPEATSAAQGNIASNGAGVVVVSGSPSGLQVSFDHGVNWYIVPIMGMQASDQWRVTYSGDRFYVPTAQGVVMSLDGRDWFLESQNVQAFATASVVAKKGSVFAQVQASAAAYTFTESVTDFAVPNLRQFTPAMSGMPISLAPFFIKAL